MTTFSDNRTAVRVNTLLKQKMLSTIDQERPPDRYARVVSVDAVARTADVVYVGDPPDNIVTVPFGSAQPTGAGQEVLITGGKHNRYISALRGRSQTDLVVDSTAEQLSVVETTANDAAGVADTANQKADAAQTDATSALTQAQQAAEDAWQAFQDAAAAGDLAAAAKAISDGLMEILTGITDAVLGDVGNWVAGLFGFADFDTLIANIFSTLAGKVENVPVFGSALESFFTAIAEGINSANQAAGAAQGAVARIQAQVVGATSVQGQNPTEVDHEVFVGPNNSALDSAHFVSYYGNTAGPHILQRDNLMALASTVPIDQVYYARGVLTYSGKNQSITAVLGSSGSDQADARLLLRCNAAYTVGCYANEYNNKFYLGNFTRSGNAWTYNDWSGANPLNYDFRMGDRVEYQADEDLFRLLVNGAIVFTKTQTGTWAADRLNYGIGMRAGADYARGKSWVECFRLREVVASNLYPPPTDVVPTWSFSRTTAASQASTQTWSQAGVLLTNQAFQVAEVAGGPTIQDSGRGQIKVNVAGRYLIIAELPINTTSGTDCLMLGLQGGMSFGAMTLIAEGKTSDLTWSGVDATVLLVTWQDLPAGYCLQLVGIRTSGNGSVNLLGGRRGFFKGTLVGTGPTGPPGLTGPQGATGSTGIQGPQGPPGLTGPAGLTGSQGIQGIKGDTGSQGVQGAAGATGQQGTQGLKGDTGAQGIQGTKGDKGDKGDSGTSVTIVGNIASAANLPTGLSPADAGKGWITNDNGHLHVWTGTLFNDVGLVRGPQGLVGPAGPQGIQGATGSTGAAGPQGIQGSIGPTGSQGPQGQTGDRGLQGLQGNTGPQGPIGLTGDIGPQGSTGNTGAQGNPGPQGMQGIAGPQGEPGPVGPEGPEGPDGPKGDTGDDIHIDGTAATYSALPGSVPNGSGWVVVDTGKFYIYNNGWPAANLGVDLQGTPGPAGPAGPAGPQGPAGEMFVENPVGSGLYDTVLILTESPVGSGLYLFTATEPTAPTNSAWEEVTQAAYDALGTPDPDTLYLIVG